MIEKLNNLELAELKENEVLDDLLDGKHYIIQNRQLYCFTSDSVKLADFVEAKKGDTIIDLCSGSGIIGILLNIKFEPKKTILVELQQELAGMSERTIALNGLKNIEVINQKLQGVAKIIGTETADKVVVNPPYEKKESGFTSENESIKIARSEETVELSEIVNEAAALLKYGGELYICIPSKRMFELSNILNKFNFKIKQAQLFLDKKDNARLTVFKAVKGGKDYANVCVKY